MLVSEHFYIPIFHCFIPLLVSILIQFLADPRFVWNRNIMEELIESKVRVLSN
jgi:hypothetical protein